jgi:hypothetical protein
MVSNDYLKFWKVIRYFVLRKYDLSSSDLDILLFLYSERYFSKTDFKEYDELLSWDVRRFKRLMENGWIQVFREKVGHKKALYEISHKGKTVITTMYKKLNGEEIPMSSSSNPMFARNVSYFDKVYRNMIKRMNAEIIELRQRRLKQ